MAKVEIIRERRGEEGERNYYQSQKKKKISASLKTTMHYYLCLKLQKMRKLTVMLLYIKN
jgi:hypothetical protein